MRRVLLVLAIVLLLVVSVQADNVIHVRRLGALLPDWCPPDGSTGCIALWKLEEGSGTARLAEGGSCSTGSDCDFVNGYSGVERDATYYEEGSAAAKFGAAEFLYCTQATCGELDGNSSKAVTWGGWFRTSYDGSSFNPITNYSGGSYQYGYALTRSSTYGDLRCRVGDGTDTKTANGTDTAWTLDIYHHAVCVHNGLPQVSGGLITAYLDAENQGTQTQGLVAADTGNFYLTSYGGQADEAFVYMAEFSANEVCRVSRCGIRGEKCLCSRLNPATFKTCSTDADCYVAGHTTALCNVADGKCSGRAISCTLPACNAAAPT